MQRAVWPIVLAVVLFAIAIYYLIPGLTHPLVSANPTGGHIKHALLFAGLAVLSLIWARFAANAAQR